MRRTITVALIVGTLLTLINQWARLVDGDVDAATAARVAANYLIPWCVSSIGFISARRTQGRPGGPDLP
ncbi:MAG: nitrate/nitrite transporter NrtS [Thermoleophilia bacterium]